MLAYKKIYINLLNILHTIFNPSKPSLQLIMRLYKWLYKNNYISFYNFSELYYILQKFNNKQLSIIEDLFVYTLYSYRTVNFLIIFKPLLKNNKLLYFFNILRIQKIKTILIRIKNEKQELVTTVKTNFITRYSPTNVSKYLHNNYLKLTEILYLRKNKVFNKGRYSRNRQFYRTGVYWCLYINIIAIVGLYFWFYRFVMNFGYLWWLLYLSLASFLVAKSLNYGFLNPKNLIKSIYLDFCFFINIFVIFIKSLIILSNVFFKNLLNLLNFNPTLPVNIINLNILFFKTLYNYIFQFDTSFKLFSCTLDNYYIYSITLNYNRVFLNTKKYKFTSMFTREWEQIDL